MKHWWEHRPRDSGEGRIFKAKLIAALEAAREVRLAEHSDEIDFYNRETGELRDNPPNFDYRTKPLTSGERADLLRRVKELDPANVGRPSFCGFSPHHRIEIEGATRDALEVCFQCQNVAWNGNHDICPDSLVPLLMAYFQSQGFEPKRDWQALAREAEAGASGKKP